MSNIRISLVNKMVLVSIFIGSTFFISCYPRAKNAALQQDDAEISKLFTGARIVAPIEFSGLNEASGLAQSHSNSNYLWSHNDSGGAPHLFLFNMKGEDSGRLIFENALNRDWEDMSIGKGPIDGLSYLYVADIGDNNAVRNVLSIYRTPEPNLKESKIPLTSTIIESDYDKLDFVYEDGARDAEAIFVDPNSKDIYIVTKREPEVRLYKVSYPQELERVDTARFLTTIPYTFITAADLSFSGNELLVKNYENVYYWKRTKGETIMDMLSKVPLRLTYQSEAQGEAVAWSIDGARYFTISESDGETPVNILEYSRN